MGEDAHVDITAGNILKALCDWALVGCDVVLHGDDVVPELAQRPIDLLAVLLEVAERRGDVDPGHATPSPTGSPSRAGIATPVVGRLIALASLILLRGPRADTRTTWAYVIHPSGKFLMAA